MEHRSLTTQLTEQTQAFHAPVSKSCVHTAWYGPADVKAQEDVQRYEDRSLVQAGNDPIPMFDFDNL